MKILSFVVAALLAFFGFVFIAGSQGQILRIVLGVVLLGAAAAFVYVVQIKPKPSQTTIVHQVDLTGDTGLEQLKCQNCGGVLDKESIEVKAGTIFVNCPYCGTSYQFEEAPKW